jgi:hypothetical protein
MKLILYVIGVLVFSQLGHANELLIKAAQLYKEGKYKESEAVLRRATPNGVEEVRSKTRLSAMLKYRSGNKKEAISEIKRAISEGDIYSNVLLCDIWGKDGQKEELKKYSLELLKGLEEEPRLIVALATCAKHLSDLELLSKGLEKVEDRKIMKSKVIAEEMLRLYREIVVKMAKNQEK